MNWKEFFRPTWSKFLLFLVIMAAGSGISILASPISTFNTIIYFVLSPFTIITRYLMLPVIVSSIAEKIALVWNAIVIAISAFINLFWIYTIACFFVAIFGRNQNVKPVKNINYYKKV